MYIIRTRPVRPGFSFCRVLYGVSHRVPLYVYPLTHITFLLVDLAYDWVLSLKIMDECPTWSADWKQPKQAAIAFGSKSWEPPRNGTWRNLTSSCHSIRMIPRQSSMMPPLCISSILKLPLERHVANARGAMFDNTRSRHPDMLSTAMFRPLAF